MPLTDSRSPRSTFSSRALWPLGTLLLLLLGSLDPLAQAAKVPRTVLFEEFGFAEWPFCPEARAALHQIQTEVGAERTVFVEFHVTGSLQEPASTARFQDYGLGGSPTVWVDGAANLQGSVRALSRYEAEYDSAIADSASLSLELSPTFDSRRNSAQVELTIHIAEDIENPEECVVQTVVVEDDVFAAGRSLDRAVREVLTPQALPVSGAGQTGTVTQSISVGTWVPERLSFVSWVQRIPDGQSTPGDVLNAAQSRTLVVTPVIKTSWGKVKAAWR